MMNHKTKQKRRMNEWNDLPEGHRRAIEEVCADSSSRSDLLIYFNGHSYESPLEIDKDVFVPDRDFISIDCDASDVRYIGIIRELSKRLRNEYMCIHFDIQVLTNHWDWLKLVFENEHLTQLQLVGGTFDSILTYGLVDYIKSSKLTHLILSNRQTSSTRDESILDLVRSLEGTEFTRLEMNAFRFSRREFDIFHKAIMNMPRLRILHMWSGFLADDHQVRALCAMIERTNIININVDSDGLSGRHLPWLAESIHKRLDFEQISIMHNNELTLADVKDFSSRIGYSHPSLKFIFSLNSGEVTLDNHEQICELQYSYHSERVRRIIMLLHASERAETSIPKEVVKRLGMGYI